MGGGEAATRFSWSSKLSRTAYTAASLRFGRFSFENVLDVQLDGVHAHEQVRSDLAVGHAAGDAGVNLSDKGTLRYAKITVAVGFKERIEEEKLKEVSPLLRDSVINVVTDKSFADLHSGNGVRKLKAEIKKPIAERMEGKEVVDIYLDGFAMQ